MRVSRGSCSVRGRCRGTPQLCQIPWKSTSPKCWISRRNHPAKKIQLSHYERFEAALEEAGTRYEHGGSRPAIDSEGKSLFAGTETIECDLSRRRTFSSTQTSLFRSNFDYTSARFKALTKLAGSQRIQVFTTDLTIRELRAKLKELVERGVSKPVVPILRNSRLAEVQCLFTKDSDRLGLSTSSRHQLNSIPHAKSSGISLMVSTGLGYRDPVGYCPSSSLARTRSPAAVRVFPIRSTMVSYVRSGVPRQFAVMWQKSRCSILFHLSCRVGSDSRGWSARLIGHPLQLCSRPGAEPVAPARIGRMYRAVACG